MLDNLSTGSIDNIAHLKAHPRFHYTIDTVTNEPLLAELVDRCDVVVPPGRRGRREADRRSAGRTRSRPTCTAPRSCCKLRQQEEEAGADRLDVRGLRQERRRAVPRGRRPGAGPDHEAPLGLRLQQGDRRVPRARLLEGAEAAGDRRPAVQHRRAAADRAVRDGRSRTSSGRRSPASRSPCSATARSRAASPTSATSCGADGSLDRRAARRSARSSTSATASEITIGELAERIKAMTGSALRRSCTIPYDQAYEAGFEDMPRRVPDISQDPRAHRLRADRRARRDPDPRHRLLPAAVTLACHSPMKHQGARARRAAEAVLRRQAKPMRTAAARDRPRSRADPARDRPDREHQHLQRQVRVLPARRHASRRRA